MIKSLLGTITAMVESAKPSISSVITGNPITSKPQFKPSQNWTVLKKTLPKDQVGKKRKRNEKSTATTTKPKQKNEKTNKMLTTYNPWRPNDSIVAKSGNPALVLTSKEGQINIKFHTQLERTILILFLELVDTLVLTVKWLERDLLWLIQ